MSFGTTFMGEAIAHESTDAVDDSEELFNEMEWVREMFAEHPDELTTGLHVKALLDKVRAGAVTVTDEDRAWLEALAPAYDALTQAWASGQSFPKLRLPGGLFAGPDIRDAGPLSGFPKPPYRTRRDPRIEAHAVNQARAAARSVLPGIDMQVVLSGMDALRVTAYRGLHALSQKISDLANRFGP
jgi:hypothetical protein